MRKPRASRTILLPIRDSLRSEYKEHMDARQRSFILQSKSIDSILRPKEKIFTWFSHAWFRTKGSTSPSAHVRNVGKHSSLPARVPIARLLKCLPGLQFVFSGACRTPTWHILPLAAEPFCFQEKKTSA